MTDLTAPVDNINHDCAEAVLEIRAAFAAARERAATWQPRPIPKTQTGT